MKISARDTKANWNRFLIENSEGFLQSFEWGDFQKKFGKKVWRFEVEQQGSILAEAQIIKEIFYLKKSLALPFCFFYIPFGPIFKKELCSVDKQEAFNLILEQVQILAQKKRAIFLRIEPLNPLPQNVALSSAVKRLQPQKTLILNIEKPIEQLLKDFHYRTRYNIKLAKRKGISLRLIDNSEKDIAKYSNVFYGLLSNTAKRQGFAIYPRLYYQSLLNINTQDFQTKLFLAEYQGEILTANIVIFFGKMATHIHGCSAYKHRALKAPNFLQWEQILEAKNKACSSYDFWGIDTKKYPGVTSFKKGFGGQELEYPQGKNLIFKKNWYKLYQSLRSK